MESIICIFAELKYDDQSLCIVRLNVRMDIVLNPKFTTLYAITGIASVWRLDCTSV